MTTLQEAYDMIDRVLRNTLYDDDYAEHSAALDLLSSSALAQQGEQRCTYCDGTGDVHSIDGEWRGTCPCAAAPAPQPAQEPVKFLVNGTRFKMSFFQNEDEEGNYTDGTHVMCFDGYEKVLDGRWVALVAAENDCHLQSAQPEDGCAPNHMCNGHRVHIPTGECCNKCGATSW